MRNSVMRKCILTTCFILTIYPLIRFWMSEEASDDDSSDEIYAKRKYPELEQEIKKYERIATEKHEHYVSINKTRTNNRLLNGNSRDSFVNEIKRVPMDNRLAGEQREQAEIEKRYKTLVNISTDLPSNMKYMKLRPDDRYRVVESKPKNESKAYKQLNKEMYDNVELAKQLFKNNFAKHNKVNATSMPSKPKYSLGVKEESIFKTRSAESIKRMNKLKNNLEANFDMNNKNKEKSFANIEPLPDYDLPLISKDSVGQIITSNADTLKALDGLNLVPKNIADVKEEVFDQQMRDVIVVGTINTNCSYAVFSTTTENREALSFVFLLPLTVLSWKRIGFESVVIIVGSREEWNYDPMYRYVMMTLQRLGTVIVFFEPRPEKSVMISQVSRIFIANILHSAFHNHTGIDDVYILTTDTDIWPLTSNAYQLPHNIDIISLNSDCCPPFSHRGRKYRMLPMANVGARIRTWRTLTETFGTKPKTVDDILSVFVREFGPMALRSVNKGENTGWFLDQMMISILIENFMKDNSDTKPRYVKFVSRDVGIDRVDRSSWSVGNEIGDKIDSHLLLEAFTPSVWVRLLQLIRLMYGVRTAEYDFCVEYYEQFQDHFIAKYRSGH